MLFEHKEHDVLSLLSGEISRDQAREVLQKLLRFGLLNEYGIKALRECEPKPEAPVDAKDAV